MDLAVLTTWHRFLFAVEPTSDQLRLYTRWPAVKGFADCAVDEARADAVIVLGLLVGSPTERVTLCVPAAHEVWMLAQIERVAMLAFKNSAAEQGRRAEISARVAGFVRLFNRFVLVSRVLQLPDAPTCWLAFGFSLTNTLPEWLSQGLLPEDPVVTTKFEDLEWPP